MSDIEIDTVGVLLAFNAWRRGWKSTQLDGILVGKAIDAACDEIESLRQRVALLEHDMKSGDYETLYAQTVHELATSQQRVKELDRIEKLASCETVKSFISLSDEDKRKWFAISVENSTRRKQAEEELAALKQQSEPVAWRKYDGEGGYDYATYEGNEHWCDWYSTRDDFYKGWCEPLYTATTIPEGQLTYGQLKRRLEMALETIESQRIILLELPTQTEWRRIREIVCRPPAAPKPEE